MSETAIEKMKRRLRDLNRDLELWGWSVSIAEVSTVHFSKKLYGKNRTDRRYTLRWPVRSIETMRILNMPWQDANDTPMTAEAMAGFIYGFGQAFSFATRQALLNGLHFDWLGKCWAVEDKYREEWSTPLTEKEQAARAYWSFSYTIASAVRHPNYHLMDGHRYLNLRLSARAGNGEICLYIGEGMPGLRVWTWDPHMTSGLYWKRVDNIELNYLRWCDSCGGLLSLIERQQLHLEEVPYAPVP